jgi:hypothetical protein
VPRQPAFRTTILPNDLLHLLEMPLEIKDIPVTRRPPLADSTHLAADIQRRVSVAEGRASVVATRAVVATRVAAATQGAAATGITIKENGVPGRHCT